ncbi:MAG: hypothetical protein ACTSXP_16615 [Promethearchaeota archaeon]
MNYLKGKIGCLGVFLPLFNFRSFVLIIMIIVLNDIKIASVAGKVIILNSFGTSVTDGIANTLCYWLKEMT